MRRLQPTGDNHGSIWGVLPEPYPTEQAERVYRYLLDQMPAKAVPRILMGNGFQGVAYRFRAAIEHAAEFEALVNAPGGAAPSVEGVYGQERALFGFFVAGLACVESFAFAIHAIAAFYKPKKFGLSSTQLSGVSPGSVAQLLANSWPKALASTQMTALVSDQMFLVWGGIRNVLSHRVVPPRTIYLGGKPRAAWRLLEYHGLDKDEALEEVVPPRRLWLGQRIRDLWNGVEQSFPPP